ncbi:hypothetical protein F4677DRAFT_458437 [Hypoxylon crocopeplum]|nr:hypothetical protein F4677DRAFT_458437 [Hypoxylon crocopeplum]
MEAIRKFISPNKRKENDGNGKKKDIRGLHISRPLESLSERQRWNITHPNPRDDSGAPTMDFIPRSRGRKETLACINNSGNTDDLSRLLDKRDHAGRQVHQGPRTKGTMEVQRVLREPSIRSLEELYHVRKQAELTTRYGVPGEIAYNFGKSMGWNKANAPRLPSLQLTGFDIMMKEYGGRLLTNTACSIPPTPSNSVDRFDPGTPRTSSSSGRQQSPTSEPGGWRDRLPDNKESTSDTESQPETLDIDSDSEVWMEQEARIVTMMAVPISQVRKVNVNPRERAQSSP